MDKITKKLNDYLDKIGYYEVPVTIGELNKPEYFIVGDKYWQIPGGQFEPKQFEITFIRGKYFFFIWVDYPEDDEEHCVHMETIFAQTSEPEKITLDEKYSKYKFKSGFERLNERGIKPIINFK